MALPTVAEAGDESFLLCVLVEMEGLKYVLTNKGC
jgi:hypothetical protein